jgi:hypothetical protein
MSDKSYYGASSVSQPVRKLTAKNFRELVERYYNVPVSKKFTRAEYHSYDKDTQDHVKDGPYVTAAVFNGENVRRVNENCTGLVLALLDFDSLTKAQLDEGFVPYADQFFEAPEVVKNALHPFNFVCYETMSSRPGQRRMRIVVDLELMDVSLHKPAVAHLASLLGVDLARWRGRVESMTLSLPMFRPVAFIGEDSRSAILCSRTDGRELEEIDVPRNYEVTTSTGRTYAYECEDGEGSGLMFMPVPGLAVEDVTPVVNHLDPDESYHTWVMVGMALRHQFQSQETESREAYELFDAWSSKGAKYVDDDETYAKWASFRPDATGRAPVTIRSVFQKALNSGWDSTPLAKKVKRDLSSWIRACVDPDELMERGPAKIAALPFKNHMVEEALCNQLRDRIAELNKTNLSLTVIKKAVTSMRRKEALEKEDDDLPPWLRPWVFISPKNVFKNMLNGTELSPEAYNNTFSRELMNASPDSDSAATGRPAITPVNFALNLKKLRMVDGTTYDPSHGGEEPFFEYEGRLYLNEFRASSAPRLNPELAAKAGKIFCHALEIVVGPTYLQVMLDFFAHTVQYPGKIIRFAPLIQSAQGAGKNMLLNCVGHALGYNDNFKTVNAKQVLADYNEWLTGAQLIVLDEIKIPGHSKADLTNSLKDLITNDTVTVNQKFQDVRIARNVANKVALTNWHDALYLEDSDRRWMPIQSPIQTKAQCVALSESGHFKRLAKLYKHGGALRQFLLDHEISSEFPADGPAPETEFRREMITEGKNRLHEAIEDLIEDSSHPLITMDIVFMPALTRALGDTAKDNYKPSHFLRRMGFEPYDNGARHYVGSQRGAIWVNRENFDEVLGSPLEQAKYRLEQGEDPL